MCEFALAKKSLLFTVLLQKNVLLTRQFMDCTVSNSHEITLVPPILKAVVLREFTATMAVKLSRSIHTSSFSSHVTKSVCAVVCIPPSHLVVLKRYLGIWGH